MESYPIRRLVFIRPGALGDTLLALPSLALARAQWPTASIHFVARRDVGQLARASGLADDFSPYDSPLWTALFADEPPANSPVQRLIADSTVVAWLPDADGAVQRNLQRFGAQASVIASGRPIPIASVQSPEHLAVTLARALVPLGVNAPVTREALAAHFPPLHATPAEDAAADNFWRSTFPEHTGQTPVIALHAGSGGAAKCWPSQSFAALIQELVARGCAPLLIEGPLDDEVTRAALAASSLPQPAVARNVPLGQLVALLQCCASYIGNDSGVAHLAALAGVPTLALFGPSDPGVWAPVGRQVTILRADTHRMEDIAVPAVIATLETLLSSPERLSPGSTSH
jgi:ADP-heptose:LPS heptosyltransferase